MGLGACNPSARASKLCTNNSGTAHCNNMKRYLVIKEDSTQRRHFVISFHSIRGQHKWRVGCLSQLHKGAAQMGGCLPLPIIGCEVTACRAQLCLERRGSVGWPDIPL